MKKRASGLAIVVTLVAAGCAQRTVHVKPVTVTVSKKSTEQTKPSSQYKIGKPSKSRKSEKEIKIPRIEVTATTKVYVPLNSFSQGVTNANDLLTYGCGSHGVLSHSELQLNDGAQEAVAGSAAGPKFLPQTAASVVELAKGLLGLLPSRTITVTSYCR